MLDELGAETEFDILGLFQGVGLAHDAAVPADRADAQHDLALPAADPRLLGRSTRRPSAPSSAHVLIHEIGHHFGLSDNDMEAIEADS